MPPTKKLTERQRIENKRTLSLAWRQFWIDTGRYVREFEGSQVQSAGYPDKQNNAI